MAKLAENLSEAKVFLRSIKQEASDKDREYKEQNLEYIEQIDKYIDLILKNDTDDTAIESGIKCFICTIHIVRGILILDEQNATCLIAAESERAVRDLVRSIPNDMEMTFYYESTYHSVISEYLYSMAGEINGEAVACYVKGARKANPALNAPLRQKAERVIGSKKDDIVAEFRKLTTLKARIETGYVVMEGFLMVNRSLKDHLQVEKVVYTENIDEEQKKAIIAYCEESGIAYYKVSQGIMSVMTTTNPVPEVICSVRVKARNQKELIISKKKNFFLILDGISNPDNLGMVLRTADASGVDAVILLSPSTHHFNKNAIRGGRGAVGRIPIYFCSDDFELMDVLHEHNFKIWGTSARFEASNFYDISYSSDNIAVIVGNESNGVRKEILDRCTDYVKIPMVEGQSSLNIAVAAALVLYEYDREFYQGR